jgi:hypothetical protein
MMNASGMPAVVARDYSCLSVGQKNGILALAVANEHYVLADFFNEEPEGGGWEGELR